MLHINNARSIFSATVFASIFRIIFASVFLGACKFITFEELAVSTNLRGHNSYWLAEQLAIQFSIPVDPVSAESLVSLQCEGKTAEFDADWQGRTLLIRANPAWELGRRYRLTVNGTVVTADGRNYTCSLTQFFYYGEPENELRVTSFSPDYDALMEKTAALTICFNKEVNIASFQEHFKITPYTATALVFAADKKSVSITASGTSNAGWAINKIFTWTLSDTLADDGYRMSYPVEGRFSTAIYTTLPQVESVCPVIVLGGENSFIHGGGDNELDGVLRDKDAFGIVFSKPMDRFSVSSAFSIEPSLSGQLTQDETDGARFVFVPQEPYTAGTRYKLVVAASARDTEGLSLFDAVSIFFTPATERITISSLKLDDGLTLITDFSRPDTIYEHSITTVGLHPAITLTFLFSSAIEPNARIHAIDAVRMQPLFPLTAPYPYRVSANWNQSGTELSMVWEWTNLSGENFYTIEISGGKNGLGNGRGEYLEEDVCVVIKPIKPL